MKKVLQKMSLLGMLLMLCIGVKAQATFESVDATFSWLVGNEDGATITGDVADAVIAAKVGVGSGLTVGTRNNYAANNGNTMVTYQPTTSNSGAVAEAMVEYTIKMKKGANFTLKSVSYDALKDGTDGAHYSWSYTVDGVESAVTEVSQDLVVRNNNTSGSPALNHVETFADATAGKTVTFRLYVSHVANNKKVAFSNIKINGVVNGTVEEFTTVYDIASAMMNQSTNFEGTAGELEPTTAIAASKAYNLKVDATTSGAKVGKNNADWAQINAGAVLTLMGVPEDATVTFKLYGSTGLTIKGVEYTDGQTYTSLKDQNLRIKCTTSGYIKSITVVGSSFVDALDSEGYTNTWQFGEANGAPEFKLQKSPEYTYTVENRSVVINTDNGKLNNSGRGDKWAQCNDGTVIKVPVYVGSKLSWGKYGTGSAAGFKINDQLFNDYYVSSEETTLSLTANGVSYLSYIKIEPEDLLDVTGTISGGDVNGATLILTAANGQVYSTTIESGSFAVKAPADKFAVSLSDDVAYVVSSPLEVTVSASGSVGEITITEAQPQTVTGEIVNAPAEEFTLTFTGKNSHVASVVCSAGAVSYEVSLSPDTYTISSSVGTLSPMSVESFKIVQQSATHNIYFPEAAVPAATQAEIVVDNTATVEANVYNTVTDALAAAKAGNIAKPVITLTSGQTYKEQVKVDMPDVTLKTSGDEKATITWYYGIGYCYYSLDETGYYNKDRAMTKNGLLEKHPARWGATVLVTNKGNNFYADNIIFENSFNQRFTEEEVADGVTAHPMGDTSITYDRTLKSGDTGYKEADSKAITERAAAIAFENNPKGCQLYNCVFIGSQDTYYTSGTQYVKNCDIQGNTDYIFGGGKVVFDNCNLVIGGYSDKKTSAYLTAQSGADGDRYIFRDCTVTKTDRKFIQANLGRDWGGSKAAVVYLNLKNEIGSDMSYTWTNMGGGVAAGTADLHIYDFDPAINANYSKTGSTGSNINGLLTDDQALSYYADVVNFLGFTPEGLYADALELDENSAYNMCRIAASDNVKRDVILNAELKSGTWSPITLPFAMTGDQIATVFGAGTKVAKLNEATTTQLNYTTVEAMDAATPYLINVGQDFTTGNVEAVTILKDVAEQTVSDWKFVGGWQKVSLSATSDYFFQENAISKAALGASVNGFAAYLTNASAGDDVTFTIDGEQPTAIEAVEANAEVHPVEGAFVIGDKIVIVKDGKQFTAAGARIK